MSLNRPFGLNHFQVNQCFDLRPGPGNISRLNWHSYVVIPRVMCMCERVQWECMSNSGAGGWEIIVCVRAVGECIIVWDSSNFVCECLVCICLWCINFDVIVMHILTHINVLTECIGNFVNIVNFVKQRCISSYCIIFCFACMRDIGKMIILNTLREYIKSTALMAPSTQTRCSSIARIRQWCYVLAASHVSLFTLTPHSPTALGHLWLHDTITLKILLVVSFAYESISLHAILDKLVLFLYNLYCSMEYVWGYFWCTWITK